jgi:hypothetical protein
MRSEPHEDGKKAVKRSKMSNSSRESQYSVQANER